MWTLNDFLKLTFLFVFLETPFEKEASPKKEEFSVEDEEADECSSNNSDCPSNTSSEKENRVKTSISKGKWLVVQTL